MEKTTAIPRSSLGESVYRLLWDRILDRRLHPGEKLSDLRLSDELGVSRTPVREALHRLVQDGIVRAEPNRGFYVASFSVRDIEEVYDLRAALEAAALEAAAPHLDPAMLRAALDQLDAIERQIGADESTDEYQRAASAFLEADRSFHRALAELAGNSRLSAVVEGLWAQIAVFQRAGTFRHTTTEASIRYHRRIIDALLGGDVAAAVRLLKEHIADVKVRALEDLAAFAEATDSGDPRGDTAL
ncbi:MAG: GntR family transcriptional regulator [Thermomicrobiales bacterium]